MSASETTQTVGDGAVSVSSRGALTLRARIATRLRKWGSTHGVLDAVALGLLRPPDILELLIRSYAYQLSDYDCDDPFSPERQILSRLAEHTSGRSLLSVFCGAGRDAGIFCEAGYRVVGVDVQPGMIGLARRKAEAAGWDAEFIEADMYAASLPERYDVAYLSPVMYATQPTRALRRRLLDAMASHVKPDGVIVISARTAPPSDDARYRRYYRVARLTATLTAGFRQIVYGDRCDGTFFVHHYRPGELERELDVAGFDILDDITVDRHAIRFLILRPRA